MPMSPTARSLKYARTNIGPAGVVERWIPIPNLPGGGQRRDLFGCIDLIVLDGVILIGVQACAGSGHAAHMTKIRDLMADQELGEGAREWLASPYRSLEIWSWSKRKLKRGGKAVRWTVRMEVVSLQTTRSAQSE